MGLFTARAVEGLGDRERGRILLAYGAGEHTPALALKVQHALSALNLVSEAIYPDFNRYHGAEAIGSAADLYVLRPTTKTWPAVAARVDALSTAIYTHGPQSVESRPAASAAADGIGAGDGFTPAVLVGEWPRETLPKTPRARLATWLAKPYASDPAEVAISVPAGLEAALPGCSWPPGPPASGRSWPRRPRISPSRCSPRLRAVLRRPGGPCRTAPAPGDGRGAGPAPHPRQRPRQARQHLARGPHQGPG
nr:hypothetical protein GCM10020093_116100 [Planobispora longispora]